MNTAIAAYIAAKQAENAAKKARIDAEESIINLIDDIPAEGSKTIELDGHKVTVTQRISRKLDYKAYAMIVDSIPESIRPVEFVETPKVDDKGCLWLAENEPGYWQILSKAIIEKPMKIAIKVQEVK